MIILQLMVLSCVATLVICQPIVNRPHHIRRHPPHLHRKQPDLSHQQSESQPDVLPRHPDQESHTKEDLKPIRGNKEPSHPEQNSVEQHNENVQHESSNRRRPQRPHSETRFQRLPALKHEEIHDEYGQYALRYITADNTVVSERGRLVPTADGGYVLEIEGKYQFVGDDGQLYVTSFRGGPDGFHVNGKHLPVQVPMQAI